ncbi:transmembrane and ubiquitin-like domain-containing protein 1 [Phlebotomus argentipes]|uniref:transmembrane and ubiquitin-like domain-containing protein 1 n=1 Tax=Phlebotomus argentipes TaxID=94469 RepID=UPI002893809B|nr:transmembrane and ubiquitin-like domain-containing protein 1 [Phlebotomus argentipes]
MSIIVSISDLVTAICVTLLLSIVIVLAWKSTNVREDHLSAAVLVIENSRRRLIERIHQFQYQQPHTSGRSTSQQSNHSSATEEVDLENDSSAPDDSLTNTPSLEEENHFNVLAERHERFLSQAEEIIESLEGPDEIIREMDDMTDGIRHRHWRQDDSAPPGQASGAAVDVAGNSDATSRTGSAPKSPDPSDTSTIDNCTNENNENDISEGARDAGAASEVPPSVAMRIKLKYLDDVQRTVQGRPTEAIGDFKRRNFSVELAADKLVRLVFNGHVLQPDSKTLQACGLFDNCVVHCLIHKKPTTQPGGTDNGQAAEVNENNTPGIAQRPQQRRNDRLRDTGSRFVSASLFLLNLVIVLSWYCRYQYGSLFTWYSTIGLAIMTLIIVIMLPVMVLINREVPAAT